MALASMVSGFTLCEKAGVVPRNNVPARSKLLRAHLLIIVVVLVICRMLISSFPYLYRPRGSAELPVISSQSAPILTQGTGLGNCRRRQGASGSSKPPRRPFLHRIFCPGRHQ